MNRLLKSALPWLVSAGTLAYVFGYAIDWEAIPNASRNANVPLFIAITAFDKIGVLLFWGVLQWMALVRFFEPVPLRRVLAVKGGSELARTVNNSLADATFLMGVSQLVRERMGAAVAVAAIPFGAHFAILVIQVTLALPFLPQGLGYNRDVVIGLAICWAIAGAVLIAWRTGRLESFFTDAGTGAWVTRVNPAALTPFAVGFALFAVFDVVIQGLASRAFGVPIEWLSLTARIPLLYLALSIPSFGNFGTREIAWANLFADQGSREELVAFALWTNLIFLVMHVVIGALFFGTAITLVRTVWKQRNEVATGPGDPAPGA